MHSKPNNHRSRSVESRNQLQIPSTHHIFLTSVAQLGNCISLFCFVQPTIVVFKKTTDGLSFARNHKNSNKLGNKWLPFHETTKCTKDVTQTSAMLYSRRLKHRFLEFQDRRKKTTRLTSHIPPIHITIGGKATYFFITGMTVVRQMNKCLNSPFAS